MATDPRRRQGVRIFAGIAGVALALFLLSGLLGALST